MSPMLLLSVDSFNIHPCYSAIHLDIAFDSNEIVGHACPHLFLTNTLTEWLVFLLNKELKELYKCHIDVCWYNIYGDTKDPA